MSLEPDTTDPRRADGPQSQEPDPVDDGLSGPRFLQRWWGAAVLGFGTVIAFFSFGQLLPGVAIGVWLVLENGPVAPAQLQEQIIPFVAPLTLVGPVPPGEAFALMFGIAGHYQRNDPHTVGIARDFSNWVGVTTDVSAQWGGANLFSSLTYTLPRAI